MTQKNFYRTLQLLIGTIIIFSPFVLLAQTAEPAGFVPLAQDPNATMLNQAYASKSLAQYINSLFKIMISVGAILAVLRIAYAGYKYMLSDMWTSKAQAKEIIGDVVLGLILLLGIYLILNQINPDLLKLDILRNVPTG